MLIEHEHTVDEFDPGHCWTCAREAGLLDHYRRVQREERALGQTHRWARLARRHAIAALWASGVANLLAVIALFMG